MPDLSSRVGEVSDLLPQFTKKTEVIAFSSTAIALYGYDQGMMSLINTNSDYLSTMQIAEESPIVGIIVSVYYLGCTIGAVLASWFADKKGRKPSMFLCLATTSIGNLLMFLSGFGMQGSSPWNGGAIASMLVGRVVMGLGVGGIDAVVPVHSSELSSDGARGKALAKEFQMNILGLLMAYGINLGITIVLGKSSQWSWRTPIIVMQLFPLLLMSFISSLPESPRYLLSKDDTDSAKEALEEIYSKKDAKTKLDELQEAQSKEDDERGGYKDMLLPSGSQFHSSMITVMGQINQALTGYGAVSVYGPQIFELLGFDARNAEFLTLGNYISYFLFMTLAWLSIDVLGRRKLMVWGSAGLATCFAILTMFGGLAQGFPSIPDLAVEIPGSVTLFIATAVFGIGWLSTVWLIPTEIYPSTTRAKGSAISVTIWGLANFAITLLTPIGFNSLKYWLFMVFAVTNAFAGWWTYSFSPETGGRSFEENQEFFESAKRDGIWRVHEVDGGKFVDMPRPKEGSGEEDGEQAGVMSPLLGARDERR